jgi:hypothetical protein
MLKNIDIGLLLIKNGATQFANEIFSNRIMNRLRNTKIIKTDPLN